MKKPKPPDHCAHVAAHYAHCADVMASCPSETLFGWWCGAVPQLISADPGAAVRHLKAALAYIRMATKFWMRAGGVQS